MGIRRLSFWTLAFLLIIPSVAPCDDEGGEQAQDIGGAPWSELLQRDYLLGDMGGLRASLADHGVTLDLGFTSDYLGKMHGGINPANGWRQRSDLSLALDIDTAAAGWWIGGEFFVHLQMQRGSSITEEYVGDFQALSNMDAHNFEQVSEFWFRQELLDGRLWFKVGKMEGNEDFAAPEYGGEFINSSAGFAPTIPLVTFPYQDWGVVVGAETSSYLSVKLGVLRGRGSEEDDPYGVLVLFEPAAHYDLGGLPGTIRFGAWYNTAKFASLDNGESSSDNSGYYLHLDQMLWRENPEDDDDVQGLGVSLQYGDSPRRYFEARRYEGVSVQLVGPIPGRDDDVIGLGLFRAEFSALGGFEEASETAVEAFYRIQVFPWLAFKPDLQYILNPGGSSGSDALAFGMRTEVAF